MLTGKRMVNIGLKNFIFKDEGMLKIKVSLIIEAIVF